MKCERSVPVLVLARVNLFVGALGLLAAGIVQTVCWAFAGPGSPGTVVPLAPVVAEALRRSLWGFRAFEVLLPATALLLTALVLAAGVVLHIGGRWARPAAMAAAAVVLLTLIGAAVYEFMVVLPGIERRRDAAFGRNDQVLASSQQLPAELRWVAPLLLVGGLILFVHAVATLVVLWTPAVAEAFRRQKP